MKKAAALAFVLVFAASMVHFYYAEDHCPVHCPTKGGKIGHVHQHNHGASTCLCHWGSLFTPETDPFDRAATIATLAVVPASGRPPAPLSADIAHPPKSRPA